VNLKITCEQLYQQHCKHPAPCEYSIILITNICKHEVAKRINQHSKLVQLLRERGRWTGTRLMKYLQRASFLLFSPFQLSLYNFVRHAVGNVSPLLHPQYTVRDTISTKLKCTANASKRDARFNTNCFLWSLVSFTYPPRSPFGICYNLCPYFIAVTVFTHSVSSLFVRLLFRLASFAVRLDEAGRGDAAAFEMPTSTLWFDMTLWQLER
jgi:hypothetical protein